MRFYTIKKWYNGITLISFGYQNDVIWETTKGHIHWFANFDAAMTFLVEINTAKVEANEQQRARTHAHTHTHTHTTHTQSHGQTHKCACMHMQTCEHSIHPHQSTYTQSFCKAHV